MAGIGSRQQRHNLYDAFLSDLRRLPAVGLADNNVGEIGRVEQSVEPFDEDGADLLDEAIEVEDAAEIEPALERRAELGVGHLLRFELLPTARVNEDRRRKVERPIGEGAVELVPNEKGEAENEEGRRAVGANESLDKLPVKVQ